MSLLPNFIAERLPSQRAHFEDGHISADQLAQIKGMVDRYHTMERSPSAYATLHDLIAWPPKVVGGVVTAEYDKDKTTYFIDDEAYVERIERVRSIVLCDGNSPPYQRPGPRNYAPGFDQAISRLRRWKRIGYGTLATVTAGTDAASVISYASGAMGWQEAAATLAGSLLTGVAGVATSSKYKRALARNFTSQFADFAGDRYIRSHKDLPESPMIGVSNMPIVLSGLTDEESKNIAEFAVSPTSDSGMERVAQTNPNLRKVAVGKMIGKMLTQDDEPGELWVTDLRNAAVQLSYGLQGLKLIDDSLITTDSREKHTGILEDPDIDKLSDEWDLHFQSIKEVLLSLATRVAERQNIQKLGKALDGWRDGIDTITEITDEELRLPPAQSNVIWAMKDVAYHLGIRLPKDTLEQTAVIKAIFEYVLVIKDKIKDESQAQYFYAGLIKQFGGSIHPYVELPSWDEFSNQYILKINPAMGL